MDVKNRELHVTSPLMSGPDVLELQEKLENLGYLVGILDGAFGPTMSLAVRTFQRYNSLEADGVVGPKTRAAIATATAKAVQEENFYGQAALIEAMRHVGVSEDPKGSNRTQFGVWFGVNGVPWCNIFVSYCFSVSSGYILAHDFPGGKGNGIYAGKGCAYVPSTMAWLKATDMWIGRSTPALGDIAIFNWDGGKPDHIGIVIRSLGGGKFESVEGNTAVGNDSNGGQVMVRKRSIAQVDGFGRVFGEKP